MVRATASAGTTDVQVVWAEGDIADAAELIAEIIDGGWSLASMSHNQSNIHGKITYCITFISKRKRAIDRHA